MDFEDKFSKSNYSIGTPKLLGDSHERAIKVPSLSELSAAASKNLSYAPFVLKADIAQFFPSIYTHTISWAAHGIENSKKDTDEKSKTNYFNALDFFIRNGQRGHTRGVLVGPDAYRIVAEYISVTMDEQIEAAVKGLVVGAVRHVDDYYFGLKSEADGLVVLSKLREVLAGFELQLNDQKTR
ncbi:MAG: RNA-directed DNA polymerase, partial [Rhodobacteraceae bacterium]|nr:RNA-directed DNA polymerase [Paracoccaceae bacterium]